MRRRTWIQAALGVGCMGLQEAQAASELHWRTSTFVGLGTTLSIRAAHTDLQALDQALIQARRVVGRIEDQMSLFRPTSAIRRLNDTGVLYNPPLDLLHVLRMSQRMAAKSKGAFDITVQPLWELFDKAAKQSQLPAATQVQAVREQVGWQHLSVESRRVRFMRPNMRMTLNGIAQGYAADLVRVQLAQSGVMHALINMGEWSSLGQADGARDWTLGIGSPREASHVIARLRMCGKSVATSADDQCSFSSDHVHHHIFNPKTGYSPRDISSVTVVADSCAQADALTKVLFVAGYDRALQEAQSWGVMALVVDKNGKWKASPALQVASVS